MLQDVAGRRYVGRIELKCFRAGNERLARRQLRRSLRRTVAASASASAATAGGKCKDKACCCNSRKTSGSSRHEGSGDRAAGLCLVPLAVPMQWHSLHVIYLMGSSAFFRPSSSSSHLEVHPPTGRSHLLCPYMGRMSTALKSLIAADREIRHGRCTAECKKTYPAPMRQVILWHGVQEIRIEGRTRGSTSRARGSPIPDLRRLTSGRNAHASPFR
ncbi:hypothetical protein SAMN05444747_1184 [Variovorax sp. OV329]|nr:hypothetical protein SAMN05444747_1184 [Variovorax sp. OV329]